jgi:hypothetical protein
VGVANKLKKTKNKNLNQVQKRTTKQKFTTKHLFDSLFLFARFFSGSRLFLGRSRLLCGRRLRLLAGLLSLLGFSFEKNKKLIKKKK